MSSPNEPDPPDERRPVGVSAVVDAPIDEVFAVVAEPHTYPLWLVGAQRIRAVDDDWPAVGSAFHHLVGLGPAHVADATRILEIEPPHRLVLEAGIGWLGDALVRFELVAVAGEEVEGEQLPGGTAVHLEELPLRGPVRALWRVGGRPALRALLWGRNAAAITQLNRLVAPAG